ncbi:MAG TPA: zinc-binding dehydrogenase [Candidatus Merdenecus merdavium]|nr:zinc-binding dehydrogenase [Candidatus Merdenecus merdavium]
MKALVLQHGGSIKNLQFEDIPVPKIKANELLIKVHAVALNPSDYQTAEALGELSFPIVLGLDVAGEVVAMGEDVKRFSIGQRVFFLRKMDNPHGGFAEFAVTPESFLCEIPKELDYIQASALPGAGMTAYHIMYDRFKLHAGKTILIHGGAGGVGSYLIQMAKLNGLRVITTCSRENEVYVKQLGADFIIDYKKENIYERINEITHHLGVDYVVNTISGESSTKDMKIMKFGCELAAIAGLPDMTGWKFYDKGISIHEIAFGNYLTSPDKEIQAVPAKTAQALSKLVADEKIKVPEIQKIKFEEIPKYLHLMKERKTHGKVVASML